MKHYDFYVWNEDERRYFYWMSAACNSAEEVLGLARELYLDTSQNIKYKEQGILKRSRYYPER